MIVSQVVAVARNGVIGRDGGLPWRLSSDLKRFKALTMGKPILMGRVCYDSIGKPLPGRPNIVMTRQADFAPDGVVIAHSFDEGLELSRLEAAKIGADEICVIGGGVIYAQAMAIADLLHVTHIDVDIAGDTLFPEIDPKQWEIVHEEEFPAGERDDYPTRFVTYKRR